jgi:hypothetical protein
MRATTPPAPRGVFSARLYGSRSHKTKRLLNELTEGQETEASSGPTEVGRRVRTRDGIVRKATSLVKTCGTY